MHSRFHSTKNMILTSIQFVFIDFRSHCYVTSGDVITPPSPCEGSGNTLGGSCIRSRIYPTPCFFQSTATRARGLGCSLRFTHAQTNSMHVCAFLRMRVFFTPCPESHSLIGRQGSREQIDDVSNANEARDPLYLLSLVLLSFSRSDWSGPS